MSDLSIRLEKYVLKESAVFEASLGGISIIEDGLTKEEAIKNKVKQAFEMGYRRGFLKGIVELDNANKHERGGCE